MLERSHLRRLSNVWCSQPLYFVTTCIARRRNLLANACVHEVLRTEWQGMTARHGWAVGRSVVMPDHVHFFVRELPDQKARSLADAIGSWKQWSSKQLLLNSATESPFWQAGFFDHILRSTESESQKWDYVRNNPVRAGLVAHPELWPFQGSIHFQ